MLKQDLRKLKQLIDRVRDRLGSKVGFEQTHAYPFGIILRGERCLACIEKEDSDWIDFYFCKMSHAKINQRLRLDQMNLYLIERIYWKEIWDNNGGEFDPIWNTKRTFYVSDADNTLTDTR